MENQSVPPLTRQESLQRIQERQQEISGGGQCIVLPPAIAAVIIASQYDPSISPCGIDSNSYTIDLVTFLNVAGYLQIAYGALHLLLLCCSMSASQENKVKINQCLQAPACCLFLFYLIWAGIGLYIYDNEMSEQCQSEPIAKMILSWSIIQYALVGLALCCVTCICFCALFAVGAAAVIRDEQSSETDPLNKV